MQDTRTKHDFIPSTYASRKFAELGFTTIALAMFIISFYDQQHFVITAGVW